MERELLLEAALGYAELGWPVFPVVWRSKEPLTSNGFKDASTDPERIRTWWRRWPIANVAVATGAPGPDVLDVDTKDDRGGMELYDRARHAGLLRGGGAIVRTPSGGLHIWFDGTDQPGGAIGPKKALELKAVGGYVLLPPSYVESKEYGYAGRYEVVDRQDNAGTINFAAVRRLLSPPTPGRPARSGHKSPAALAAWLAQQAEGNRNDALYWACARSLDAGNDDLSLLVSVAVGLGLSQLEATRTAESARHRPPLRARKS